MAIDLNSVVQGVSIEPPRIIIYGVEGIGKTTLAANAPAPIIIQTEDGLGKIDAPRFPLATSLQEVMEALTALAGDHSFQTLVIDSLDWLERLVWKQVCQEHNKDSIEDFGYGKGYIMAIDKWQEIMLALNWLRANKNMAVILTAHSEVVRFDDPNQDSYDRYHIKLHKRASAIWREFADITAFANYRIITQETETGFNNKRTRAVGGTERLLFLEERAGFTAKNRYGMPPELPLSWDAVAATIPFYNAATQEKAA